MICAFRLFATRALWILAAVATWTSNIAAQAAVRTVVRDGTPYSIAWWDSEDDLPQNSVFAITQTRDGYLWLGTLNGLVRFDGLRFTVFDESNTPGLESSRIVSLFDDSHGSLWIGTETAGIARLYDGQITSTGIGRGVREGRLVSACEDASGAVWLYTWDGQLWRHQEGRFNAYLVDRGSSSACRSIIAEKDGPVWVGTSSSLSALAANPNASSLELPVEQSLPVTGVDLLLASRSGGYWRLGNRRIQKWTQNRLERDWGPYPWLVAPVSAACEDREGNLVVGTLGAGLFWFDASGKVTGLSTNEGLSYNFVLSLCLDREGSLWVGTDGGGLNRVRRQAFQVLEPTRGWVVQSVCEDHEGRLWMGANGGEVGYWQGGAFRQLGRAQGLPPFSIKSVFADQAQRLWLGSHATWGPGLFRWQNERFHSVPASPPLPAVVQVIHQDRSNHLWLGTQEGLARWDEREWKTFTTRDGLSSDVVRAIADDAEGNLWVGTVGGGLNRLRDGQFTAFRRTEKDGLPSDDVSSLWVDEDGVLWIGTLGSGLARFHQGRWTRYTTREGLVSNSVGYLLQDDEGYLWIGSNAGLMRVKKRALNDLALGRASLISVRTYRGPDGLPTRECTQGSQPGACRARDGTLWFPTIKGLAFVKPSDLNPNTNPPPVMIESVLIEGQPQESNRLRATWPQAIRIPPGKERVEIHYTSLNLAAPDKARFRYQLHGHENAPTEAGSVRVAHFSKLPPRQYRFEVTACNEDGVWNQTPATLTLIVQPPFWRTWWFLTATTLALLATIIAVVHYLSTQRLQRQVALMRQQEALEKERARIARDLHDQLGANLTQVSLLGEMVESDKALPDEVEAHGRQISQTARETTRALDEIVWAANPANDTLEALMNYACKYAQEYLALAGIRYRLDVPTELPGGAVPPELRHNVFLAFKEAVNNVVKHAQATGVWVRLKLEPGWFTLEVEDNGRGPGDIHTPAAQSRNGLRNMRKRMEDVGGQFAIAPAPEAGTVVRLTAPLRSR
jgi:ligand-binding sensor domain-containing protein/signal transduction histidine kinase